MSTSTEGTIIGGLFLGAMGCFSVMCMWKWWLDSYRTSSVELVGGGIILSALLSTAAFIIWKEKEWGGHWWLVVSGIIWCHHLILLITYWKRAKRENYLS